MPQALRNQQKIFFMLLEKTMDTRFQGYDGRETVQNKKAT